MRELAKKALASTLWTLLGRRNLVRLGRFLTNEGRLDIPNNMATNGEQLVQETACQYAANEGKRLLAFDVGANVGEWSQSLLDVCRRIGVADVRVYAFEPCRGTYDLLLQKVALSGPGIVTTVHKALSDRSEAGTLFVTETGAGTNSLHLPHGQANGTTERVELSTIDEYCKETRIDHITIVKVDTEGHDLAVMRGASEMLGRHAIELLQFEYNHRWILSRTFLRDAFALLKPFGYRLGKITPKGIEFYEDWEIELETFREGNYLACLEPWVARFPRVAPWWDGHR
jgi:FkbM family methyltransferase